MHVRMLQLHGSDIDRFGFVSSYFCQVLCSLSFHPCPHISCVCGLDNLQSFANCSCILVLKCDPHACRYGQNKFF